MPHELDDLTPEQKQALSDAARIVAAADGIPFQQALELVRAEPDRLRALSGRLDELADRFDPPAAPGEAAEQESAEGAEGDADDFDDFDERARD